MKVFLRSFFLISILLLSEKTFAYTPKEGNVSAILGPFFYKTNFSGSPSGATSPYLSGTTLMAIGDISDHGSLELGIFYLNKIYFRERYGNYLAEKTQLVHITMGYRRWWTSYLSTSLSFFSAYSLGDVEIVHSDFQGVGEPTTSARDKTEYGFDAALQGEVWSLDRYAVDIDLRYSRSVTNQEHENADHYGIFVGLRYFIQEKQKAQKPKN